MIYRGFSVPQRVEHDVLGDFDRTDLVKSDWLKTTRSGSSWIRRQWSDDVSLNDRYRLQAAVQIIELRQAENDPFRTLAAYAQWPD